MSNMSIDQQLQQGIAAARQGKIEQARQLLLDVIAKDEANSKAWLWLSSVVESVDDRRTCLENVLVTDPENPIAKRGLDKLAGISAVDVSPGSEKTISLRLQPGNDDEIERPYSVQNEITPFIQRAENAEQVIRREVPPVSPAAAVLYPERQVKEWRLAAEDQPIAAPVIPFQERSQYDDIWEKEIDICAFCAGPVAFDAESCSHCRRKLSRRRFRYPNMSSDSIIYLVLLLGVGQLYFIKALLDIIGQLPLYVAIWHGLLFALMLAFAAAVYFRQVWAYYGSIVFLIMSAGVGLIELFSGSVLSSAAEALTGIEFFMAVAENPFLELAAPILEFLPSFQLIGMILALLYGILKVYPDFAQDQFRLLAAVDRGLSDATQYYAAGKENAVKEMWANAVLCWQRAAALDPTRAHYQRVLANAYARLGFFERSLDAYRSAMRLTSNLESRQQLEAAMTMVKQKIHHSV